MKKIRINLFIICLLGVLAEVCAQESTWREMPYFLKGYEKQYKKSPKEAALSWFKDARFGLFVHWGPASLYGQGEWVMYNNRIPIKEYEQKAREFKGDKISAQRTIRRPKQRFVLCKTFDRYPYPYSTQQQFQV